MMLTLVLGMSACRTRDPATQPGQEQPKPIVPTVSDLIVPPTRATTNDLRHVTYTFNLPRPPASGYIIQESLDGVTWTELGRSTATNFTRVTFVDATPSSGKYYRVVLP